MFEVTVCYMQTLPDRDMDAVNLMIENRLEKLSRQLVDLCRGMVP